MKHVLRKAGAAIGSREAPAMPGAGSIWFAGKWLALSTDRSRTLVNDFVDELVLSEEGPGSLKRFEGNGRVRETFEVFFDPRIEYLSAVGVEGERVNLPYERSRDGRLSVRFPAHEKRVFVKSAQLIGEVCTEGDLSKILRLGIYYFLAGSEECVLFFTEAERRGLVEGKVYLGNYYYYQDKRRAFGYYLEAASQGHPQAELYVGLYYLIGEGGIEQDREKGMAWLSRAAEQGNAVAVAVLSENEMRVNK
jgi:hypothetical protein